MTSTAPAPAAESRESAGAGEPLEKLNPAQREAVLHFEGPLLVLAGAGSGKTRVLTSRIAHLIRYHGVDPSRILAVTFTNKAADEMRSRIARLLGQELSGMWCGTFHAIGARILRFHARRVGRTPAFTIYDEDDTLATIKRIMERVGVSAKQWAPKAVANAISDASNALVTPEEYARVATDPFARAVAPVFKELEPTLRTSNAVTFDDLLVLPVKLLRENDDVLSHYRERFQFILVDEYQDTNRAQFHLVKLLGSQHGNVAVVGDDDQSIYGWRGADIRNILDFEKEFASARVVRLEENYRSTPGILEVANAAISSNTGRRGKILRPTRPRGEPVTLVAALDDRDEADFVVDEIRSRQTRERRALRDFAVLYRTNAQSRPLEDALRRCSLPYRLVGAVRFYDRKEIRDLVSYLKLIANPSDDEAFMRAVSVPRRKLGETTLKSLAAVARGQGISLLEAAGTPELLGGIRPAARQPLADFAALIHSMRDRVRDSSVDELLRDIISAIRYIEYLQSESPESASDRRENVAALIDAAAESVVDEGGEVGLTPLDHFLQRAMLLTDLDKLDRDADAVTLMTLHNAKGLEFPVVFITGLEDGLFPSFRSLEEPDRVEEERRLFYVGITRSEQKLFLCHAEKRRRNGEFMPSIKSRFLGEIAPEMLEEKTTMKLRAGGRGAYSRGMYGRERSPMDDYPRTRTLRTSHDVPDYRGDSDVPSRAAESPAYVPGDRVRHRLFGSGTIAALSGAGSDLKAVIDFDDAGVGRKTIKLAYTTLDRGSNGSHA